MYDARYAEHIHSLFWFMEHLNISNLWREDIVTMPSSNCHSRSELYPKQIAPGSFLPVHLRHADLLAILVLELTQYCGPRSLVNCKLSKSCQCDATANTDSISDISTDNIVSRTQDVIILLYTTLVRPHLEHYVQSQHTFLSHYYVPAFFQGPGYFPILEVTEVIMLTY